MNPMKMPLVSNFVSLVIPSGHGWAIASAKNTGDKE
jgi:hypothetical protein